VLTVALQKRGVVELDGRWRLISPLPYLVLT
jgi:hypothetical protein